MGEPEGRERPTPPGSKGWERKRLLESSRRESCVERAALRGWGGEQLSFRKGHSQPNVTSEGGAR